MRQRLYSSASAAMLVCLALTGMLTASPVSVSAQELSLADLIERTEPCVVRIDTKLSNGTSQGSGFVVDARGWVVTNHHVIAGALSGEVSFSDGAKGEIVGVLATDKLRDVAVIKVRTDHALTALPLAVELPRKGESAVALGSPQGLSFTATEGIISAVRSAAEMKDQLGITVAGNWLQTSAPISPGSSGGPLLNRAGQVVGANAKTHTDAQNVNFAICAADIKYVIGLSSDDRMDKLTSVKRESTSSVSPSGAQIVCKLPAVRRFNHRYRFNEDFDDFDKTTELKTQIMPVKFKDQRINSCVLEVTLNFREQSAFPLVFWEITTTARAPVFNTGRLRYQLLVDGKTSLMPSPVHKMEFTGRGSIAETMMTLLSIDEFLELVVANEVRARVGGLEYSLERDHLEALREAASRLPEGTTTIEGRRREGTTFQVQFVLERMSLEDDPTAGSGRGTGSGVVISASPGSSGATRIKPGPGVRPRTPVATTPAGGSNATDERSAAGKLALAKVFIQRKQDKIAKRYLLEIMKNWPNTEAGKEAAALVKTF